MTYKQKYNDLVGKYDLLAKQYENLKNKYIDVLKMAKESADTFEYCLRDLEKEIDELKGIKNNEI